MKRFAALLISFALLLSPVSAPAEEVSNGVPLTTEEAAAILWDALAEVVSGSKPGLDITLTSPEGESVSGGFGLTEAGFSAHADKKDASLLLTESTAYLSQADGSISVPLESLLSSLYEAATGSTLLPIPTENDLKALEAVGLELLSSLSRSKGVVYSLSDSMLSLHINLDQLLHDLDALLPETLERHAQEVDALLAKFTPALLGQAVTLQQLTELWRGLGLGSANTGAALDVILFQSGGTLTLLASGMNWQLKAEISDDRFAFALNAPNGQVYELDTTDLQDIASILRTVPDSITEEAVKIEQVRNDLDDYDYVFTNNIHIDLALLERDLKAGFVEALSENRTTVEALCKKIRPWLQLYQNAVVSLGGSRPNFPVARFSYSWLTRSVDLSDFLPDGEVELNTVYQSDTDMLELACSLIEDEEELLLLDGCIAGYDSSVTACDFALRAPDSEFVLTLNGVSERSHTHFTLACSEDLGGFHSITYSQGAVYAAGQWYDYANAITTDTDIFHLIVNEKGLSLKALDYSLSYCAPYGIIPERLQIQLPNGFFDLISTSNGFEVDSSWGGMTLSSGYTALLLEGYINSPAYRHQPTTFTCLFDLENKLLTASILPYNGGSTHLRYHTGELSLLTEGSELKLTDAGTNTPTQNTALLTFDGDVIATIVTDVEREEDFRIRVSPGADTTAACWEVRLDVGAPGRNAPADAVTVTAEAFFTQLNAVLNPPMTEPMAEENPSSEEAAEFESILDALPALE